jgi:hypothetical protein
MDTLGCALRNLTDPCNGWRLGLPKGITATFFLVLLMCVSSCSPSTADAKQRRLASVSRVDFGNVTVGASGSQVVVVTNTGDWNVNISGASIAGNGFSFTGPALPLQLPSGQSLSFSVIFLPSAPGSVMGTFSLSSNIQQGSVTISLSGTGVQPLISVSPTNVIFGNVPIGVTSTQAVAISNSGNADLDITQVVGPGNGFNISGPSLPMTVAAGGSATITVNFTPSVSGTVAGSLSITSNAPASPTSIALTGAGVAPAPQLSVSPAVLSFGSEAVGATGTQNVTLTNNSNLGSITVSAITVSGPFAFEGLTLPATLNPGQSATFSVTFTPSVSGTATGILAVTSTAENSPTTITLAGTGGSSSPSTSGPIVITFGTELNDCSFSSSLTCNGGSGNFNFPLAISYGILRFWDTGAPVQWQGLHVCNSTTANCLSNPQANTSLSTATLDAILAGLKGDGVTETLYTGGRVPTWAHGATSYSPACNYGGGTCVLPTEMNADGSCSGANSTCPIWDTFWHLLATHVNDPTFLQTHAHIKYWEPWNEWFEDPVIGSGSATEVNASWAEMLRMTEDMRCIIKGVGTIHNYPTAGSSASCSSYLATLGWSAIDANALIVTPDSNDECCQNVMKNFLYCNTSPHNDLGVSTSCTWSGGLNWGSQAVDVIDFHFYFNVSNPEAEASNIATIEGWLSSADLAKPLINGEGASGASNAGNNIWNDDDSAAGGLIRQLALYWSGGVSINIWYAYSTLPSETLYANGALTTTGTAWMTAYGWLNGSTPTSTPFCSHVGTLYTCSLQRSNGKLAQLVWDSQYGPHGTASPSNCSFASVPLVCGNTTYSVPSAYQNGTWIDASGASYPFTTSVTVGAVPILLQAP